MVDLLSFLLFSLLCFHFGVLESATTGNGIKEIAESKSLFHVGVVLDLNSSVGAMADVCLSMALSDFYARHSNYQTRLLLHTRDSADIVSAGFAVLDLLKKEEVQAIIGPQTSTEAPFVIELGGKVRVPIISFSATSLSLSPAKSPYFIRAAQNDSSQLRGIAAIVQEFGWHEVVLFCEDTEYYNGIVPYLTDAFQDVNIRVPYKSVIPKSATDFQIVKELNKLMTMQTRVFLVHMTTSLGSRLFQLASKAGMMSEGYAWLITDDLSNLLDAMDPMVIESMEGVLGLRPYVPRSRELQYFKRRWKRKFSLMKPNSTATELNIFGLWAYDAVWALAMAVERIGWANFRSIKVNNSTKNATDLAKLGISEIGPWLLNEISNTRLKGISGEFQLVNGQLQRSAFEIFNVMGEKDRAIGYWTPGTGLSRKLAATDTQASSTTSTSNLKKIIWPGDSTITPKGWAIPTVGKLKIGIPVKQGFNEFVEICRDPHTNKMTYKGFSIDVFRAVLDALPFKVQHEFIPFMNDDGKSAGSYDDLLYQIYNKSLDAVVGDTTIVANRTSWVDFALPYSESGVSMLVSIKHDKPRNMWIFIKPLSGDLWLTIIAACICTGLAIAIMEHRVNTELGSLGYFQRVSMIFWLPFSMLVFPDRERVNNRYSRFVLVIWLCLAYILMQSYTACLSSILTVDQLQPTVFSVKELVRKGYYVGYQEDSFVKDLLINQLNFNESKLKPYSTIEEYNKALSKGSHNGGVAAIFDEIPYIKLFLKRYGSTYMMAGPTYRTDGFGFAFPIGSPLVSYVSRAILNVTEGEKMNKLEKMYFGEEDSYQGQAAPSPPDGPILTPYSFAGLFIITGSVIFLAFLGSQAQNSFWQILVAEAKYYIQTFLPPQPSNNIEPRVHCTIEMSGNGNPPEIDNSENPTTVEMSGNGDTPEIDDSENPTGISNQNDENVLTEEEKEVYS